MACSYEQFEEVLKPETFYTAGIPRVRVTATAFAAAAPFFLLMALSRSARWIAAGYLGFALVAVMTAWAARHWTLRHWSATTRRARDGQIVERLIDALLAMYPADLFLAREELTIDLAAARRDQRERRSTSGIPPWFGSAIFASLTAALSVAAAAGPRTGAVTIGLGVAGATLFLFTKRLVDWAVPARLLGHDGYVRLLFLAKRRLDLELLKSSAPTGGSPAGIGCGEGMRRDAAPTAIRSIT